MITKRDQDIFNFLEEFHIATSNQIHRLFFSNKSYRYSRKRLKYLFDQEFIKRTRSTISNDYAYYINKKPIQIHHDLIRSELYTHIKNSYTLLEWTNETTIVNIRPDAVCYVEHNKIPYPLFIEIHLNNKFNFEKYKELAKSTDLKAMFGVLPKVIICSDRKISISINPLKFKLVTIDMNGLNSIFN